MASVRVYSNLKNENAFAVLLDKLHNNIADSVVETARTMLEVAVERTPKYSGQATQGWRVTLDKSQANSAAWDGKVRQRDTYPPPKYEGGIWDAAAGSLNAQVVGRNVGLVKINLVRKLAEGKPVSLYLYNIHPYTTLWLSDESFADNLREVNRDFWTMEQIKEALRYRMKGLKQH